MLLVTRLLAPVVDDDVNRGLGHANLKWTAKDPLSLLPEIHNSPWQILKTGSKINEIENQSNPVSSFIPAKGSVSITVKKRKLAPDNVETSIKKQKTSESFVSDNTCTSFKKRKFDKEDAQRSSKRRKTTQTSELLV